jgi:hypothetical protein
MSIVDRQVMCVVPLAVSLLIDAHIGAYCTVGRQQGIAAGQPCRTDEQQAPWLLRYTSAPPQQHTTTSH